MSYTLPPPPPPPPQAGGRSIPSLYFTFTLNHDKRENNFRNTLPPLQSTPSCSSEDATSPSPHSSGPHPCALPDFSRLTHGFTFRLGPARRLSVMARPRRCCSCSPSAASVGALSFSAPFSLSSHSSSPCFLRAQRVPMQAFSSLGLGGIGSLLVLAHDGSSP